MPPESASQGLESGGSGSPGGSQTTQMPSPGPSRTEAPPPPSVSQSQSQSQGQSSPQPGIDSSQSQVGTSPSPAPQPSTPAPTQGPQGQAAAGAGEGTFDWSSDIFDPTFAPSPVVAQPSPQQTPVQVASEAPMQPQQPVVQVEAQSQQGSAPPQGVPAQGPLLDPTDLGLLARTLQEHEAQAVEQLAQSMFKMTSEEREALESDFIGSVPKLLARAVVKAQQQNLAVLGNLLPQIIQRMQSNAEVNTRNEDKFYQRWPGLDRAKHNETVRRYAMVFRRENPTATLDQMIEQLGPIMYLVTGAKPQVSPPVVQSRGNGTQQPPPFVPAAPGVASQSTAEPGPFDWLGVRD